MVGVVLAGGASTRMKSPKALAKEKDGSFLSLGVQIVPSDEPVPSYR